jgi:uncharacterized protein (TIGR03000 family)
MAVMTLPFVGEKSFFGFLARKSEQMYSIVLATVLTAGNAAPAADVYQDLRYLKRSVAQLREEQSDMRIEELKLLIAGLRQRITDEKLDELGRDIRQLQREEVYYEYRALPLPMPSAVVSRATIAVEVPAGATFIVNKQEVPVPAVNSTFVTPPLEPNKDYFYDCKVTLVQDGKTITKIKRVKVRAGAVVRLTYEDMETP